MPRKSRIDAPLALHDVMARGIERRPIFGDDSDRYHFLSRLGEILTETKTACYAWALIPNHVHLVLRTGLDRYPYSGQRGQNILNQGSN